MKRTSTTAATGWAILAVLTAQGLAAQETVRDPELDRLHDEAMALAYGSAPGGLERAAWAHAPIAYQRGPDDAQRFECLRTQAELFGALGYIDGASLYLEEAARQAERTGDTYGAAMTWIDAALLAWDAGNEWKAWTLAVRARELASSSDLDREQRARVLDRLSRSS